MAGLTFFKTKNLEAITEFYQYRIGMELWLDQGGCKIFRHDNFLLGFCQRDEIDTEGIITFFYESQELIDELYERFKKNAINPPKINNDYQIYHFFVKDPEGRMVEFQKFLNPLLPYKSIDKSLIFRRSIRSFKEKQIPNSTLNRIFEYCRFSPTSRNSQSFYYITIKNKEILQKLSLIRGKATSPLTKAPMAVAVCVDSSKTQRVFEDGHIASYHFILAAFAENLGTCWIADMNREEVKSMLHIPQDHYIATITPLGYSDEKTKELPKRRFTSVFVKEIN